MLPKRSSWRQQRGWSQKDGPTMSISGGGDAALRQAQSPANSADIRVKEADVKAFETAIEETSDRLIGPWRQPRQMLHAQVYDSHASIHDDATAQKLGFQGGTIEGPTHFSQFAPLCERIWGRAWFETGCLSAHYRNPAFEGEEVQANIEK